MKNKLYETGDFGKGDNMAKINSDNGSMSDDSELVRKVKWADPKASRELVIWLMGCVNTQQEYEMLQSDLVELDAILATYSEFSERRYSA